MRPLIRGYFFITNSVISSSAGSIPVQSSTVSGKVGNVESGWDGTAAGGGGETNSTGIDRAIGGDFPIVGSRSRQTA